MEFCKRIYEGRLVHKNMDMIKEKLMANEYLPFIHVITLPLTKDGILEIYPAYVLSQKFYQNYSIYVVGIAANSYEAKKLVNQIVNDCYQKCQNFDIKSFCNYEGEMIC